jgi:hypothetical protein
MKKILLIAVAILAAGCGLSEECIKKSGHETTKDVTVTPFTKISVFPGIALVVKQGNDYSVTVRSGENIINDVNVKVADSTLTLKDGSGCNFVRSYNGTTVYVTAPNIIEIYSNTNKDIRSDGVLTYPMLRLFSMDFFGGVGTGDFYMTVNNSQLVVESNHIAAFYITGQTQQMLLYFYNGIGRFEGPDFLANEIQIIQRGSNDMIIHPVETLSGDIYSTGNVISKSHPPNVNVVRHYSGKLIYD